MSAGPSGALPVPEPGALRALRAEIGRAERLRLLESLRFLAGVERGSYRRAIEALEAQHPGLLYDSDDGPGALWASVCSPCDSVELYEFDEDDDAGEPDPFPVRIVVLDGVADALAGAFLGLDDAEQLFRDGLKLVAKIRRQRASRSAEQP